MILSEDVYKIGYLSKPHGLGGEINFHFENDSFDEIECPYFVLNIDGIFVPFFIEEYRFKGASVLLIRFKGVDNADKALELQGCEVFFPKEYGSFSEQSDATLENTWFQFLGYEIWIQNKACVGKVTQIDAQTINNLLLITNEGGRELIIPAVESWIVKVDEQMKQLHLILPEGLMEDDTL